ncbi:hypothetical protein PINS_up004263 [Pythium insidiosum]|nr:hypothetical protein PINS_up004263 [Pythium insidiosum]
MRVFNLDFQVAQGLISQLPPLLSLSDLSRHNFIEHDVSLVHADLDQGQDPSAVDPRLAEDALGRATNGALGVNEIAAALRSRLAFCRTKRCTFGPTQQSITFSEMSFVLQVFGGNLNGACSVDFARSFLVNEQIPAGWNRPGRPVRQFDLTPWANQVRQATMGGGGGGAFGGIGAIINSLLG